VIWWLKTAVLALCSLVLAMFVYIHTDSVGWAVTCGVAASVLSGILLGLAQIRRSRS
jgi:hypothetical protein